VVNVKRGKDEMSATRPTATFADAAKEFDSAWSNPNYTTFTLPPVDVNKVLAEKYVMNPIVRVTRKMVWDMELRKAWDPRTFIPYVVSEGRSWGRHEIDKKCERFSRASMQLGWITPEYGQVLEDVFIDHSNERVLFFGRQELTDEGGGVLKASSYQPIFHVEHAASGTEQDPLNLWRIVLLTPSKDERFAAPFKGMIEKGLLPGFLEIYIEKILKVELSSKH
jgi:hypothetical protein